MAETAKSLTELTGEIRQEQGVEGKTHMEGWEARRKEGKNLTEAELNERIAQIERGADQLNYGGDLERSMYLMLLERMRLRVQVKDSKDLTDVQSKKDLEVLQDLERRIAYWQYEEAAFDEILDAVEEYETYRQKYKLDRPESEGGIPRDAAKEAAVRSQLTQLKNFLPVVGLVRKISYFRYRLSGEKNNTDLSKKVSSLIKQLPDSYKDRLPELTNKNFDAALRELSGELRHKFRIILGETSPDMQKQKLTTPLALELERDAISKHFVAVIDRRKALTGVTGAAAERQKELWEKEHVDLLSDACTFNIRCVNRRASVIALLVREGNFDQPVADGGGRTSTFRYGPLTPQDRAELAKERIGNIETMQAYIRYLRADVLREEKSKKVPLVGEIPIDPDLIFEDLWTTHVIPVKLKIYVPAAKAATAGWAVHDAIWEKLSFGYLDLGIREARMRSLLQPIYKRLHLPDNYDELSPADKKKAMESPVVQERIRSVKKIIDDFKKKRLGTLEALTSDLSILKTLSERNPKPKNSPVKYTSMPDVTNLKTDEEVAGAMLFLVDRIFAKHLPALDAAQREYITKVNENLGLHIDLADVELQLRDASFREIFAAITALAVEGILGALILKQAVGKGGRALLRGAGRTLLNLPRYAPRIGVASLFAYRAYLDYQKIGEISGNIEKQRAQMILELKTAGFLADPPGQESTFRYKSGDTEIKVNIAELKDALGGQETAQEVRVGGSIAQAALILGLGVSRAVVPVMIVEVAAEAIRYGLNQESDREFLSRAPAWLIAKINLENAIGETGYSMLAKASGEMLSHVSPFMDEGELSPENKEKQDIRNKMLFQILMEELREFPELRQDILGDSTHPVRLDLLYKSGFKDVFLPVFYARLFELVGKRLSWEEISKGQIDSDWNIPLPTSPKITLVELRHAMRESIVFYTQHTREEQYLAALKERAALEAQLQKEPNQELQAKKEFLDTVLQEMGDQEVFGKKLNTVTQWGDRVQTGTTRASEVVKLLFAGAPKHDSRVGSDTVQGLPGGFSFGSQGAIYSSILAENPVLRAQLNQVLPKTIAEPEGRIYPSVWSAENFELPTGYDARGRTFAATHAAANNVIREANQVFQGGGKLREMQQQYKFNWLGGEVVADSESAARKSMTEAAILLCAHGDFRKERQLRADTALAETLYPKGHRPLVLVRYRTRTFDPHEGEKLRKLVENMRDPLSDDPAFAFEKLTAVCFEAQTMSNGNNHPVVLATYIFGDVVSQNGRPQFRVIQRAISTSTTGRGGETVASGMNAISNGENFLKQPGTPGILEKVRKGLLAQEKKSQEAAIRQAAAEREQMTQWEREKPVRDQKQALQEQVVRAAEQRARRDKVVGYVPGMYVRDEEKQVFRPGNSDFQSRYGDWILRFDPDMNYNARSMRAAGSRREKDGFKFDARNEKTGKLYQFNVDIDDLKDSNDRMSKEDIAMASALLTTPLDITGHPQEHDKTFVEKVRKYELHRLLSIATYKDSYSWDANDFRNHLEDELWPYYRDAKKKDAFLQLVLRNLVDHSPVSGGITGSTYETILKHVKRRAGQWY